MSFHMTNHERCNLYFRTYICDLTDCICKTCSHRALDKPVEDRHSSRGYCSSLYKTDEVDCSEGGCHGHKDWIKGIVE